MEGGGGEISLSPAGHYKPSAGHSPHTHTHTHTHTHGGRDFLVIFPRAPAKAPTHTHSSSSNPDQTHPPRGVGRGEERGFDYISLAGFEDLNKLKRFVNVISIIVAVISS